MPLTIYGIRNCDTMKKALAFLEAAGVAHHFHDYRKAGVPEEALRRWCRQLGWEEVLNRRGTTYRRLAGDERARLDEEGAIRFMLHQPSAIRRPVLEGKGLLLAGFSEARYAEALPVTGLGTGEGA